jgi:acyl carrier protein
MVDKTPFEMKLAGLICDVLNLEDMGPDDIEPQQPLFDGGLGLDSIDALEIAVAVSQEYGIHLKAEDENSKDIFATLRSLATHISEEAGSQPA